jgi:uncharacterized SAM-binding protein YcdF (DUF218 family)
VTAGGVAAAWGPDARAARRRARRRVVRRRVLTAAAGALTSAWVGALVSVLWAAHRDRARPAAAIVVLGAAQYDGRPSPVLRARLDHAVALWRRGIAPRMIVTGGSREGDRSTEAAAGRRYVVEHGVPDSAVLLESEGQTTSQSLRAVAALLRELRRTAAPGTPAARAGGPDAAPSAVLVSDPFHMLRLGVLARRYGITAYMSPTPSSPISANPRLAWSYLVRESLKVPVVLLTDPDD